MRRPRLRALTAALLLGLWWSPAVPAAAQIATATLSGTVRDDTGAALPNVTVTARSDATGATRRTTTSADGRYRFAALDPGRYEVRAELASFKTAIQTGVILTVGGTTDSDITMSLGQIAEQVTVGAEAPLIESAKTELSRVVSTVEIESLPISGRNFVDFVKLSSGVATGRENVGGGAFKEPDVGVGSAAAPRLSFGGQPELNTMIQVDGADNIQTFTGLPRATPSQEAAREFRVLNSTYLAEYGRALGGFVNIVTKSGTNRVDGSVYLFGMHDALNARSVLNTPDADVLHQSQFGATIGGPLAVDRTFIFGNYEGQLREQSNRFSTVVLDNLATLNAVRAQFHLAPETTNQLQTNHYNSFLTKVDHHLTPSHSLSVRYNFLDSNTDNFLGGGGRASPTSSTARDNLTRDQALAVNALSVASARYVNEARFQAAHRTFDFTSVLKEPALELSNFIIMGKSTSDVDFYGETRIQFSDSLTMTRAAHQYKAGVDINELSNDAQWHLFFPARIIFPTLAAFQTFTPAVFWWPYLITSPTYPGIDPTWITDVPTPWQGDTGFTIDHGSYGLFVQDHWQAGQRLTVTYGLRYDLERYPSNFITQKDLNNWQPRVGAAYAYSPRGVIRGGYGVFTDRLASSVGQLFNATAWSSAGSLPNAQRLFPTLAPLTGKFQQRTVGGALAPAAAVTFLTTGQVPSNSTIGLADTLDGAIRNPYSHQASGQISQEVGNGIALSASYLFLGARQVPGHTGNLNAFQTGTLPSGKPILGGRTYPEVGDLFVQTNTGMSNYHGVTVEAEKRMARGVGFHGSYTLSSVRNNVDSLANLADLPEGQNIQAETSRSRQDVRHRATLALLSEVPSRVRGVGGFRFSGLVSIESGRPFNIFAGRDFNLDGNPNSDRPSAIERNLYEGPAYASVDLRVGRDVRLNDRARLELSLDLFNLFNRTNVKDVNTVWGSADYPNTPPPANLGFGSPRDVFNPFQMQFGVKVKF
jgi:carboxypeptidase family protein/TonB-dependent receptor-like protein